MASGGFGISCFLADASLPFRGLKKTGANRNTAIRTGGHDGMKLKLLGTGLVHPVLGCLLMVAVPGSGMAAEPRDSGWYVGAGAGVNWISDMKQAGWNRDTVCYPEDDCDDRDVGGYRWFYDLDADTGSLLEIAVGRSFGNLRLELSASLRENDIDQEFTGITYLDGSTRVAKATSNYSSKTRASVDDLETRTLSLNAYYDFPLEDSRITPYLGAGVGVSYVKLSGLVFEAEYACSAGCDYQPAEYYNSFQDESLSDTVFSKHLHVGADYDLGDGFLLGMKLSYSMVDDMRDKGYYVDHPIPDLPNHTKIRDMDHWSLSLGLKYLFGR